MKLNILERIALLNVLPRQGSALTLRIILDLQRELSFTEEEMEEYKMKNTTMPDGRTAMVWDEDFSDMKKDIKIGKVASGIIERELTKLNNQERLPMEGLGLYERFVEGKTEEKA